MRKKRLIFITMSVLLSVTAISGCGTKNSILPENNSILCNGIRK